MTGASGFNLCCADTRTDLEQLIVEASLLLERPDSDLAPHAAVIADAYEAIRDAAHATHPPA